MQWEAGNEGEIYKTKKYTTMKTIIKIFTLTVLLHSCASEVQYGMQEGSEEKGEGQLAATSKDEVFERFMDLCDDEDTPPEDIKKYVREHKDIADHQSQAAFEGDECTFLHYAANEGSIAAAKETLASGVAVDIATKTKGTTPLHLAAAAGKLEMVKYLVSKGADVNKLDNVGANVLHYATYGNHPMIVKYFVEEHKMSVYVRNIRGVSLLHLTADVDAYGLLDYIIEQAPKESGKDLKTLLNCQDTWGGTPLHRAAALGRYDMINLLLEYGADKAVKMNDGAIAARVVPKGWRRCVGFWPIIKNLMP